MPSLLKTDLRSVSCLLPLSWKHQDHFFQYSDFFLKSLGSFSLYVHVCFSACGLCTTYAHSPAEAREGIGLPGTGLPSACDLPHECWELNLCLLGEQPVLSSSGPPLLTQILGNRRQPAFRSELRLVTTIISCRSWGRNDT